MKKTTTTKQQQPKTKPLNRKQRSEECEISVSSKGSKQPIDKISHYLKASLCIDRQSLSVIWISSKRSYGRLSSDSGILETIKVSLKPQLVKKWKQYAAYHFSSYQFQLSVSIRRCRALSVAEAFPHEGRAKVWALLARMKRLPRGLLPSFFLIPH